MRNTNKDIERNESNINQEKQDKTTQTNDRKPHGRNTKKHEIHKDRKADLIKWEKYSYAKRYS